MVRVYASFFQSQQIKAQQFRYNIWFQISGGTCVSFHFFPFKQMYRVKIFKPQGFQTKLNSLCSSQNLSRLDSFKSLKYSSYQPLMIIKMEFQVRVYHHKDITKSHKHNVMGNQSINLSLTWKESYFDKNTNKAFFLF